MNSVLSTLQPGQKVVVSTGRRFWSAASGAHTDIRINSFGPMVFTGVVKQDTTYIFTTVKNGKQVFITDDPRFGCVLDIYDTEKNEFLFSAIDFSASKEV